MNILEEILRKKMRMLSRKINRENAKLSIEKRDKEIVKIKTNIAELNGKFEAYLDVLKIIIAPQPVEE